MRKYFLTLTLIITCLVYPQNYWQKIQTPVDLKLNTLFCLDSTNIWIGTDSGKVLFTSDKGNSWSIQNTGITERIEDVFFITKYLGYALAVERDQIPFRSYIFNTTDGGNTWEYEYYRIDNVHLHKVFFLDSLTGFLGGSPQEFVYTTNGGTDWNYPSIFDTTGAFFPVYNFSFYDENNGFAVGGYFDRLGVVWKTTDRGLNWYPFALGADPVFNIHILDTLNLFALSGDIERLYPMEIYRSRDFGISWEVEFENVFGFITSSDFRNNNEIWATLGSDRLTLFSVDTGYTWEYYTLPDTAAVYAVQFIDSLNGFMIGDSGAFFVYQPQDPSSVIEISDESEPQHFKLFQNYPNPFNTQTSIEYFIESPSLVKINILNILGEKILELDSVLKEKGNHSDKIDLIALPSGVYFYQLTASNLKGIYSETKKMVLLK